MMNLIDLPTFVLVPGVVFKQKGKTKEKLYWLENQGTLIKLNQFLFFIFTRRIYSNKSNMHWLTFPFESSLMT
jgi:hypothetical protein